MALFKEEREKGKALLLLLCPLPSHLSAVSQNCSFIYSSSGPVIQRLAGVFFNQSIYIWICSYPLKPTFTSFKEFRWIVGNKKRPEYIIMESAGAKNT